MNQHLQNILAIIQQDESLTAEQKNAITKSLKDADKEFEITSFKLDRTEKVKRTTAILLEETIAELEQKRKAVEAQNRELEIESSLERVRTVAMGMKKPDDLLSINEILFKELQTLGFSELRNTLIHTFVDEKKYFIDYDFSDFTGGCISHIPYNSLPFIENYVKEIRKTNDAFTEISITGKELEEWKDFRRTSGQMEDPRLDKVSALYYYNYSIGVGDVGISTFHPITDEKVEILKRFRNVFDLAYRRYIDIQQAEAQAMEAQIELALERVRARAMAMQNSDELSELVAVLFEELTKLNLILYRCIIWIFNPDTSAAKIWMANSEDKENAESYFIKKLDHPYYDAILKGWKEKKSKWVYELQGNDKKTIDELLLNETELAHLPDPVKAGILSSEHTVVSGSFNNFGLIEASGPVQQSDEQLEILSRFGKVFDLTYTRFNDLKQAEAQAREAKIEAALEKVRSRTMAMQKSEELSETSYVLFQQLKELGEDSDQTTIGIFEEDHSAITIYSTTHGSQWTHAARIRLSKHNVYQQMYSGWKNNLKSLVIDIAGEELEALNKFKLENPDYQVSADDLPRDRWIIYNAFFSKGTMAICTTTPRPDESIQLFERFAQVFDHTYRRFLDLQKAEAQAREAQIEVALERVRARAMAMHESDDLKMAVATVFEELDKLNLGLIRCGIAILDKEKPRGDIWITIKSDQGNTIQVSGDEPLDIHPLLKGAYDAWQKQEDFSYSLQNDDLLNYYKAITKTNFQLPVSAAFDAEKKDQKQYYFNAVFQHGSLFAFLDTAFTDEAKMVMKRFANVFNLTYKRFLDLQKAEAQAREAQIEASLERVRSKTMAMHNSQDVGDTVATMFDELVKLGVETVRCGIGILHEPNQMEVWTAKKSEKEKADLIIGRLDMTLHPLLQGMYNGWKNKDLTFSYDLKGKDLVDYFTVLINSPEYHINYDITSLPQKQFHNDFYFSEGALFAFSAEQLSAEASQIFKRFAGVFGQTYRRYLDLQKAEMQAREALIETGLERVRARTMAMHSSEDVSIATATMFNELEKLNIQNFRGGILNIRPDETMEVWSVNTSDDGKIVRAVGDFDMTMHPFWRQLYKRWANKDEFFHFDMSGKDKADYIRILDARRDYLPTGLQQLPDCNVQSYFFGEGAVWTFSLQPHSEEDKQVMKRFASVFSLTFRRYQDLKKAEAQAREATIEAALERVRGKAMAMHNSNDLSVTASMVFTELRKLGINPIRCGVGLLNKESRKAQLYSATSSADGDSLSLVGWVMLTKHPVAKKIYDSWLKNEDYYPELGGEQLKSYYENLLSGLSLPSVPDWQNGQKQYGTFLPFSIGCLYAWSEIPYNETEIKILRRFASIIDLTFRRYIELQTSEANAREAVKQAALDRIRADIASMRTISDLDRITPLIWTELNILGIPFIRCGVFIMDEIQRLIHTFLSAPDGKAIAAFHLPYDTSGNLSKVLSHWKDNKNYIDHWHESAFTELADILVKQGAIASPGQYLDTLPRGGFYLHFLPFLQGMLYVGNTTRLDDEEIKLIQSVADAFSTAYARYEDFNRLEAAKQQVDQTLVDLRQAQQQLVQSEKMASLGELTAGIAHEIQNPLNFVNNFSDVSSELLDEMKTELDKGNSQEAKSIADDVKQNLEKILYHGKRADAIVKGMLQHSRSSSGIKEPTDINILADEYLRLAFHGLRAKDKSFNAKFETAFDTNAGKIKVVPQEIGRVILNLINNAFYAVTEKKKQTGDGYEPTVIISTKKSGDKIEVRVKDNGPGISQKTLDKIFQPFFTTKPTGEGTGLGLSLAYDIITKGHGGEIKVETKEGEGSEFIISLPANQ